MGRASASVDILSSFLGAQSWSVGPYAQTPIIPMVNGSGFPGVVRSAVNVPNTDAETSRPSLLLVHLTTTQRERKDWEKDRIWNSPWRTLSAVLRDVQVFRLRINRVLTKRLRLVTDRNKVFCLFRRHVHSSTLTDRTDASLCLAHL
jgi:hypothetical protein